MTLTLFLAALALASPAQEPTVPPPQPRPQIGPEPQGPPQATPEEDEMLRLFGQVERRMREIDRLLYDASAGRAPGKIEESGIDKLLKRGRESSQQVLDDIDKILELAMQRAQEQQQQQSNNGGQGGQQGKQGQSPLDQKRGDSPSGRERTPEGQSSEGEGGKKPEGEQQQPQGEKPTGSQEDHGDPNNKAADGPPELPTEQVPAGGGNDRWGDLPVHVRELFRAQGGGDLPPRYRDWIDSYYRRLNQRP
jgi:hypothetical protein